MEKKFKLAAEDIRRLIPEIGPVLATDRITVDGCKVGYMARRAPSEKGDSGWEFYAGDETQDYVDDPNHWGVYSANTVANYDPEIIEFLTYPAGAEVERQADGKLSLTQPTDRPAMILYRAVEPGTVTLKNWQFAVSELMFRRIDQGDLVLWRPEFTIWISAFDSDDAEPNSKLEGMLKSISADHTNLETKGSVGMEKVRYRLTENVDGNQQNGVYIHAFSRTHEIHLAVYYDDENLLSECDLIWDSLNKSDN